MVLGRGTLADGDVDLLARELEQGNPEILDRIQGELPARAQRLLLDYVDDPHSRHYAVRTLARHLPFAQAMQLAGDDVSLQTSVVRESSADDPSVDAAVRAIGEAEGLGYLIERLPNHPAVRRRLLDAVEHGDSEDRRYALVHVGDEVEAATLETLMRERDPELRSPAFEQLQTRERDVRGRAALSGARDADPHIRAMSIQSLHHSLDPRARDALLDAMRDPDEEVAFHAASAVVDSVGGDAVQGVIALALDARLSESYRKQLAWRLLQAGYDLEDDMSEILALGTSPGPRVIQLEEY